MIDYPLHFNIDNTKNVSKIILCPRCQGMGYMVEEQVIDYHKREYRAVHRDCPACKTKGRVREITDITYMELEE